MANRDYFSRPSQGNGRDSFDYGRGEPMKRPRDPWMRPMLIFIAIVTAYFIWQFCR